MDVMGVDTGQQTTRKGRPTPTHLPPCTGFQARAQPRKGRPTHLGASAPARCASPFGDLGVGGECSADAAAPLPLPLPPETAPPESSRRIAAPFRSCTAVAAAVTSAPLTSGAASLC
jgi:hypothetical protein